MAENLESQSLEEIIEALTDKQAKFILHASCLAGHIPRYWLEKGVELARMLKSD